MINAIHPISTFHLRKKEKQSPRRVLQKKVFLEIFQNTQAQMFPCEFWKISENTFSYRTPQVTASEKKRLFMSSFILELLEFPHISRVLISELHVVLGSSNHNLAELQCTKDHQLLNSRLVFKSQWTLDNKKVNSFKKVSYLFLIELWFLENIACLFTQQEIRGLEFFNHWELPW